jgi:putative ATP-binding cassette transporter
MEPGQRIFLEGPSGCGKSTLIKAIGGLWHPGFGRVDLPGLPEESRLVPQRAYFPVKTLRGMVCYPRNEKDFTDAEIHEVMTAVGMAEFLPDLDNPQKLGPYWEKQLSGGQQQRIIFARILLHKPQLQMVDEISSALDGEAELELYRLLIDRLPDLMMINISHHKQVLGLHTHHAKIGNGTMRIVPISESHTLEDDMPEPEAAAEPEPAIPPTGVAPKRGLFMRLMRAFS